MFAGLCAGFSLFLFAFVPETKGRTLEEITNMLSRKWTSFLLAFTCTHNLQTKHGNILIFTISSLIWVSARSGYSFQWYFQTKLQILSFRASRHIPGQDHRCWRCCWSVAVRYSYSVHPTVPDCRKSTNFSEIIRRWGNKSTFCATSSKACSTPFFVLALWHILLMLRKIRVDRK